MALDAVSKTVSIASPLVQLQLSEYLQISVSANPLLKDGYPFPSPSSTASCQAAGRRPDAQYILRL